VYKVEDSSFSCLRDMKEDAERDKGLFGVVRVTQDYQKCLDLIERT